MLNIAFRPQNVGCRLIFVLGPYGCGKSTFVKTFCKTEKIGVLEFSPDSDCFAPDQFDAPFAREEDTGRFFSRDTKFISCLNSFIARAQLISVGGCGEKHILLLDNVIVPNGYEKRFFDLLNEYNSTGPFKFPIVWIIDPQQDKLLTLKTVSYSCIKFNSIPKTAMKKAIDRIVKGEGLIIDSSYRDTLIEESDGDVRLLVNMMQFTHGKVSKGKHEKFNFFQTLGEVLYESKLDSDVENVFKYSYTKEPKIIFNGLFTNFVDFCTSLDNIADIDDYFSLCDNMMTQGWDDHDFVESSCILSMRAAKYLNENHSKATFHQMKPSTLLRPRPSDPDLPFLCWPSRSRGMSPEQKEQMVVQTDTSNRSYQSKSEFNEMNRNQLFKTEKEAREERELLEEDPIEEGSSDDNDESFPTTKESNKTRISFISSSSSEDEDVVVGTHFLSSSD